MEGWSADVTERALLLNLERVAGIGNARLRALVKAFGKPSRVLDNKTQSLQRAGLDAATAQRLPAAADDTFGAWQLQQLRKFGARLITLWCKDYPPLLRQTPDPPPLLFVQGNIDSVGRLSVGIVGTRKPTVYGREVTARLTKALCEHGATVVSGLARGIDAVAHRQALSQHGRTVAVLGCGLDRVYPAEHRGLARRITEKGALVSEHPLGAKAEAMHFPRRNRIISGLSHGVLVVEARERSGALITANNALEQNRDVFAVPGSIFSEQSCGTHRLLQEGAKLVAEAGDILEEFPAQLALFREAESAGIARSKMSGAAETVFQALGAEPRHIDELGLETGLSVVSLSSLLLRLEFDGLVHQLPGKRFVRC